MPPKEDSCTDVLLEAPPSPTEVRTETLEALNDSDNNTTVKRLSTPRPTLPSTVKTTTLGREQTSSASASALGSQSSSHTGKTVASLWWIHGKGYDLESFIYRHPGGLEAILLGKGRDCTALVESYHAFSPHHTKVLEKYLVLSTNDTHDDHDASAGADAGAAKGSQSQDVFYDILKKRSADVLRANGIDPVNDRGAGPLRVAYYFLIVALVLYTGAWHMQGSIVGSFAFAVFGWLMGSLGHDAGHFAASHKYPWMNEWGVWAMSLICNPIMWQQQHTYGHHSFTNEVSHDPDVHHFDRLLRVHKGVPYDPKYQSQRYRLYVALAYSFVVFGTAFYIPISMIQTGSLYGIVDWHDKDRLSKAIGMRLHNLCYFGIVVVAPFFSRLSIGAAIVAVTLHVATLGILFAIFSQINHLNEDSLNSDMESRQKEDISNHMTTRRDPRLKNSWAAAQVETSNNFASQSWVWHLLSNGLNHQIEHHLFPGLNHSHLHHIAPVVKETCVEFGVQYKSFETWSDIMEATLQWYKQLSTDPCLAPKSTTTPVASGKDL